MGKGHVPLPILERRLASLSALVARRKQEMPEGKIPTPVLRTRVKKLIKIVTGRGGKVPNAGTSKKKGKKGKK